MCSLFGIIDYGGVLSAKRKNKILSVLSLACEVRGTDATGIAYNYCGAMHIYKRPLPAHKLHFHIPAGVRYIMGHTRMATQGSAKMNYNNHPFAGHGFALAHNGVLWNDHLLQVTEQLPYTKIKTDSYVAVQLLEQEKVLNPAALQRMAETVEGSFVFSVLDKQDNFYFVRGDNPLAIFCYDGFYLYASTTEILRDTEHKLGLRHNNTIPTKEGDILRIDRHGKRYFSSFTPHHTYQHHWRNTIPFLDELSLETDYLVEAAKSMGVSPDEIQALLDYGCDADEIEELLYNPTLLHEITAELLYGYA